MTIGHSVKTSCSLRIYLELIGSCLCQSHGAWTWRSPAAGRSVCWAAGLGGVRLPVVPAFTLSLPAASPALRGLPRRVGALPQRRPRPTSLLCPRRAARLQAVAARPGQLPRVGGESQPPGPGARRVWVCAQIFRGLPPCASLLRRAPNCGIEGTLDRVKYKEGGRKKGDIERLGERKDNCPALGLSAGPWGQDRKKEPRCLEHKGGCKGIRVNLRVPKNVQARVTGVTFGGQPGSESVESTVEERDQY